MFDDSYINPLTSQYILHGEVFRSTFQSSKALLANILYIHNYIRICTIALTTL